MYLTYVGPLGGAAYRGYTFPRFVPVEVPEDIAMRFADSAEFEVGDPADPINEAHGQGEEE